MKSTSTKALDQYQFHYQYDFNIIRTDQPKKQKLCAAVKTTSFIEVKKKKKKKKKKGLYKIVAAKTHTIQKLNLSAAKSTMAFENEIAKLI